MFSWKKRKSKPKSQPWRNGRRDRVWKKAVRFKYLNRCPYTLKAGKGLEVHHLADASTNKSKRYVVSNGILLHKKLHMDYHRYMGGTYVSTTKRSFYAYIKTKRARKLIGQLKRRQSVWWSVFSLVAMILIVTFFIVLYLTGK